MATATPSPPRTERGPRGRDSSRAAAGDGIDPAARDPHAGARTIEDLELEVGELEAQGLAEDDRVRAAFREVVLSGAEPATLLAHLAAVPPCEGTS